MSRKTSGEYGVVQGRLREIRRRRGLTQEGMSELIGTERSYWSKYERGDRRPSMTFIARMRWHGRLTDEEVVWLVDGIVEDEGMRREVVS